MNGSSALITWTHTQAPSSAYLFRIVRKQVSNNNTMVVNALPSETRAFLLKNLQPNEAYIVNVTAYVESDRTYENSSDVREFVMLPSSFLLPITLAHKMKAVASSRAAITHRSLFSRYSSSGTPSQTIEGYRSARTILGSSGSAGNQGQLPISGCELPG